MGKKLHFFETTNQTSLSTPMEPEKKRKDRRKN